jgi:fucose permease
MKKRRENLWLIVFMFLIMALNAVIDNTKGILIPIFKETFNTNNTDIGIMISIGSFAYIIFTYIGGILCERIGQKKVFSLGLIFMTISVFLMSTTKSFESLVIYMFFMNVGNALLSIGINTLIPLVFISFQAIIMNLTHFCYGAGSTVGQLSIGYLVDNGFSWRTIYIFIAIAFVLVCIWFKFLKVPTAHKAEEKMQLNMSSVFKNKLLYFYGFGLGTYVFAEAGTSSWLVNFLRESYGYSIHKSSLYLSTFFFLFTIGRLVGGFVAEKKGYFKSVLISLVIALVLFSVALVIGNSALILICISGIFFAIAFPTIALTIGKVFKENGSYVTGVVITFSSSVNMILNFIIGRLNDSIGTTKAFYMVPISLFLSIIFIYLIYSNTKNNLSLRQVEKNG